MERLGFCGIIKLTMHILLRNPQHFLCITLLYALPYAWTFTVYGPFAQVLQNFRASISLLHKLSSSQTGAVDSTHLTPAEQALIVNQQQHPPRPLFFLLFVSILLCISLVCTILVTFSVCRACLNKSVDLKGSLNGVRRSAKNLVVTALAVYGVILMFGLLATLGMVIIAAGLSAVHVNVTVPITIMAIGEVGGVLYMTIAFTLAYAVAILEEKKGWEAISKSTHLIKGSRWIVVGLYGFYGVMSMVIFWLPGWVAEFSVWRWVAGGVSVGLQAFLGVCMTASKAVLYMSCKRGQREGVETLLAASSQFGPPNSAPKYLDLETAAFATTTQ